MKNYLIIYHANCNDGFGAAWVAYNALKSIDDTPITLYAASYGELPPFELINKDTKLYILDFSYPVDIMQALEHKAYTVTWIDHHKTSIKIAEELISRDSNICIKFNLDYCGATLTWKHFHNLPAPKFIKYIEDRDLWKFELDRSEEFFLLLNLEEKTIPAWNAINDKTKNYEDFIQWTKPGIYLKKFYDKQVDNIIALTEHDIVINGIKGLVCNAPYMFASDIGNILAKKSGTFGATWYENKNTEVIFSLRSIGDFDVAEIAENFGGGGHKNAAGFKLEYYRSLGGIELWNNI